MASECTSLPGSALPGNREGPSHVSPCDGPPDRILPQEAVIEEQEPAPGPGGKTLSLLHCREIAGGHFYRLLIVAARRKLNDIGVFIEGAGMAGRDVVG